MHARSNEETRSWPSQAPIFFAAQAAEGRNGRGLTCCEASIHAGTLDAEGSATFPIHVEDDDPEFVASIWSNIASSRLRNCVGRTVRVGSFAQLSNSIDVTFVRKLVALAKARQDPKHSRQS